jgi:hypothetical protein
MGRLTLNVLLSFAQFEREVTSERIRDKIAASKRKGLWVGGPLPLGYQMKDGKIAVVEDEAERVRLIFQRYLDLGSVNALVRDLRERNIRSKTRLLATGATRGGVLFGRGSLFYLLRNRFYVGEVKYKEEILPGEQPAILDRALFDAVQQKLTQQWTTRSTIRNASDHLLTGLLFDDAGHRMVPTHATKAGVRYRYMFRFRICMENRKPRQSGQSPAFLRPTSRTRSLILSMRVSSFKRRSRTPSSHAPIEKRS